MRCSFLSIIRNKYLDGNMKKIMYIEGAITLYDYTYRNNYTTPKG